MHGLNLGVYVSFRHASIHFSQSCLTGYIQGLPRQTVTSSTVSKEWRPLLLESRGEGEMRGGGNLLLISFITTFSSYFAVVLHFYPALQSLVHAIC